MPKFVFLIARGVCLLVASVFSGAKRRDGGYGMNRSLKTIAVLIFATLALTACGKRGPLEAPGVAEDGDKSVKSSSSKKDKPHRSFVLDGLLR
jgi:predicted small lipoprotein YifL